MHLIKRSIWVLLGRSLGEMETVTASQLRLLDGQHIRRIVLNVVLGVL